MKKLIILLLILAPIVGYSQSDVFGNSTTHPIQFGNHNTFQGVSWRDKAPFERFTQDRMDSARGRNQERAYRIGRNPSNVRKIKWKKWNRQRRRAFKRVNIWG